MWLEYSKIGSKNLQRIIIVLPPSWFSLLECNERIIYPVNMVVRHTSPIQDRPTNNSLGLVKVGIKSPRLLDIVNDLRFECLRLGIMIVVCHGRPDVSGLPPPDVWCYESSAHENFPYTRSTWYLPLNWASELSCGKIVFIAFWEIEMRFARERSLENFCRRKVVEVFFYKKKYVAKTRETYSPC